MKIIKIVLVTLGINSLLLPFYGLTTLLTARDFVGMVAMGLREMTTPTCYIVAVYFLIIRLTRNWFQKRPWRVVLVIFVLICIVVLSQLVWSMVTSKDTLNHFFGFWGFYFLWTLLACTMIPLMDRFLPPRQGSIP